MKILPTNWKETLAIGILSLILAIGLLIGLTCWKCNGQTQDTNSCLVGYGLQVEIDRVSQGHYSFFEGVTNIIISTNYHGTVEIDGRILTIQDLRLAGDTNDWVPSKELIESLIRSNVPPPIPDWPKPIETSVTNGNQNHFLRLNAN